MVTGLRKRPGASASSSASKSSSSLSYFSHEFIIQNHGDIATCACMLFVVGLMFQSTAPFASSFIAPKYNLTDMESVQAQKNPIVILFAYGPKDFCLLFFYALGAIIFHAIIQEYVLDVRSDQVSQAHNKQTKSKS